MAKGTWALVVCRTLLLTAATHEDITTVKYNLDWHRSSYLGYQYTCTAVYLT